MDTLWIKCNLCEHRSDTFPHLRTHIQTVHPEYKVGYECFFCSRLLKTPYDHRNHLIRRHGDHCDLTTPPPSGKFDPRNAAKKPKTHKPPMEARTGPPPTKRAKITQKEETSTGPDINTQVFDIDELLRGDLMLSDEDILPTMCDKSIQVRKRDFLTTSRETQATVKLSDYGVQASLTNETTSVKSQTVSNHSDMSTQTVNIQPNAPSSSDQSTQTNIMTSEAETQVSFFNAGWITRTLTDAIRAIAPTIIMGQNTLSFRELATITPYQPQPETSDNTPRTRGRPRRANNDHQ